MPVIGANIFISAKNQGTTTDFDGNFSLSVSTDDVITISYVGFVSQTLIINGQNNLKINLQEDTAKLDEIVVVAYGTQKKSSLTGAVSSFRITSYNVCYTKLLRKCLFVQAKCLLKISLVSLLLFLKVVRAI